MTIAIYDGHVFLMKDIKKLHVALCMCWLSSGIHTSLSPPTTWRDMRLKKNNYQLPKQADRSSTESLWENILHRQQSSNFAIIDLLPWAHKQGIKDVYPLCFMRVRGWEVDWWAQQECSERLASVSLRNGSVMIKKHKRGYQQSNVNLPACNTLWLWIVPRLNAEQQGHSNALIWKQQYADFGEH